MIEDAGKVLLVVGALVCSTNADAQLQEEEDELEEIVVVGTPPDSFGFADVGGWLSFAVVDFSGAFNAAASLQTTLNNILDELNKASEEACQQQIESWRQQCHDTYDDFQPICMFVGTYSGGSLARAILPSGMVNLGTAASGTLTSMGCLQLTQHAHQWCDAMANSEAAPEIAQCP